MADITTNTANKVVNPMDKPIENGPPTPPETQPNVGTKPSEPDLPPVVKEPMATEQASMIPASIEAFANPIARTDAAKSSGGAENDAKEPMADAEMAAQPDKPEALKPIHGDDDNLTSKGDSKEAPRPVSVEEVPDRELGSVTQPANEQETSPPHAKNADVPGAVATGTAPNQDAQSAGPAQVLTQSAKVQPQTGEKRKADDPAKDVETNGDASRANADEEAALPAKMQKTEDTNETASTNGNNDIGAKRGRPKKEKKTPAPVGRTARKTRSQAAAGL